MEYICSLGGEKNIGFGSDFDGILETVIGVETYKDYENIINQLCKKYSESMVEHFLYKNFIDRITF